MLPDFLRAVSAARGGDRVVRELFNGAERVIRETAREFEQQRIGRARRDLGQRARAVTLGAGGGPAEAYR